MEREVMGGDEGERQEEFSRYRVKITSHSSLSGKRTTIKLFLRGYTCPRNRGYPFPPLEFVHLRIHFIVSTMSFSFLFFTNSFLSLSLFFFMILLFFSYYHFLRLESSFNNENRQYEGSFN